MLVRGGGPEWPAARTALTDCVEQLKNLSVATDEEGWHLTTKRSARRFSSQGTKDLMSAAMDCYLAFGVWLRAGDWVAGIKPEDRALFSMTLTKVDADKRRPGVTRLVAQARP